MSCTCRYVYVLGRVAELWRRHRLVSIHSGIDVTVIPVPGIVPVNRNWTPQCTLRNCRKRTKIFAVFSVSVLPSIFLLLLLLLLAYRNSRFHRRMMSSMLKPEGRVGFSGRAAGGGSNCTGGGGGGGCGARTSGVATSAGASLEAEAAATAAAAAAAAASVWRRSAAADEVGTGDEVTEMNESHESDESSDVST